MIITMHRPGPMLGDCIAAMIHFSGYQPGWQRDKLLPDGAMELVVDLTDRPKRLFHTETGPEGDDFRKVWLSGVHRRPIVIEAQPMAAMLVISFTPGGAFPFFDCPVDDLADGVFALDDVVGRAAASLRDRVLDAPSPQAMFRRAEAWLLERAGGPVRRHMLVAFLAARLAAAPTPIHALVEQTGYSERQVQALSRRWLGTSLKSFARMRRFQRLLAAIGPNPDWASLALAHGYFDQAHMGHEFRAFAAMTPSRYAADFAGTLDFLPLLAPPERGFLQDAPSMPDHAGSRLQLGD